mgnify:CR=1 FL=1
MAPYMWRVAMRSCGTLKAIDGSGDMLRGRLLGAPPELIACCPWIWLMEGMGEGLLELAELLGTVRAERLPDDPRSLDLVARW